MRTSILPREYIVLSVTLLFVVCISRACMKVTLFWRMGIPARGAVPFFGASFEAQKKVFRFNIDKFNLTPLLE